MLNVSIRHVGIYMKQVAIKCRDVLADYGSG
jgi:hypothetical protein